MQLLNQLLAPPLVALATLLDRFFNLYPRSYQLQQNRSVTTHRASSINELITRLLDLHTLSTPTD
jgi:hypothetical protein